MIDDNLDGISPPDTPPVYARQISSTSELPICLTDTAETSNLQLIRNLSRSFQQMSTLQKQVMLQEIVSCCDHSQLLAINSMIAPRLKVDFLKRLPIEISLQILSEIDDPKTMAQIACVSTFWNSLLQDEKMWEALCTKYQYQRRRRSTISGSELADPASQRLNFSYREYFKRQYKIAAAWEQGGRVKEIDDFGEGLVTALQFDEKFIVVGCDNNRIEVFHARTGRKVRTLLGHEGGVWALQFKGGDKQDRERVLVSGGCDRDVRVWDLNMGRVRHVLPGHTSTVRCLKMKDKQIAVTGSRDTTLRVWDIRRGELLHVLQGHQASVRCVEISGDRVISGSYDSTARIWDIHTGECLHVLIGHTYQIYSLTADDRRVVTGSLDSQIRVWSLETGECIATLHGHTSLVGKVKLSGSGSTLVSGGSDGCLRVWDLERCECVQQISAHDNSVTAVQFDDCRMLSAGNDGKVKLWDIKQGKLIRNFTEPSKTVWKIQFTPTKAVIVMKRSKSNIPSAGKIVMEIHDFDVSKAGET